MLMISLFPVPTPTFIRWLKPFLPIHQILRSGQMSGVLPFMLQNPPSLYSPLNFNNLTSILESLWTNPYYPGKDSLYTGSDLRSSLQTKCPCQSWHPGLTPYQHPQGPYWYHRSQQKETILPVQDHLSLISSQYLARALQPNNPSNSVVTSPSGSRNMKQTLQSRFIHWVVPHLSSGILPLTDYGTTIKSLHIRAVSNSKSLLSHNRVLQTVLGEKPPEH